MNTSEYRIKLTLKADSNEQSLERLAALIGLLERSEFLSEVRLLKEPEEVAVTLWPPR